MGLILRCCEMGTVISEISRGVPIFLYFSSNKASEFLLSKMKLEQYVEAQTRLRLGRLEQGLSLGRIRL